MWTRAAALATALAAPALAQQPSELRPEPRPEIVSEGVVTRAIEVTPLDGGPTADAVGLLPPSVTGLPRDLWSGSDATRLAGLIERLAFTDVPVVEEFVRTLLLAEGDPPAGAATGAEDFLLARVDQLVARGALDEASALLDRAGSGSAERTRRAFDVSLLTGDESGACDQLDPAAEASGDYAMRVFCLVRGGDWSAAALTFDAASALTELDPLEQALLAPFLDPEMAEGPLPAPPTRPSPLVFRLYDALGEPLPTGRLPIAFARADLRPVTGWKAQMEAAERLVRAGALPGTVLLALYTDRRPSASGGVWDRAAAVQDLDDALLRRDPASVARVLPEAIDALEEADIEAPLAVVLYPLLATLDLDPSTERLARGLGLLTADYEAAGAGVNPADRVGAFHAALARGEPETAKPYDPLSAAIAQGFSIASPEDLMALVRDGRLGEALLLALGRLADARGGDLSRLPDTVAFLRTVGLEDLARRAGLQMLLLRARA